MNRRQILGSVAGNLAFLSIVAGTYEAFGLGAGLGAFGIFLLFVSVGFHQEGGTFDE